MTMISRFPSLRCLLATLLALLAATGLPAGPLSPEIQARVDARVKIITGWAADPVLVGAVARQNAGLPEGWAAMGQDLWQQLPVQHPLIAGLLGNEVAAFLHARRGDWVSEAFVSDASGRKVAFLSKPTSWSHAGKPKHEVPMQGRLWQGAIEVDASVGSHQLQVAVPVLQDGRPIGSLVVGLNLRTL